MGDVRNVVVTGWTKADGETLWMEHDGEPMFRVGWHPDNGPNRAIHLVPEPAPSAPEEGCGACGDACNGGPCRLAQESPATAPGDALSLHGAAGMSASRAPADVEALAEAVYRTANQFDAHRKGLPSEWEDWADEVSRELCDHVAAARRLSGAQQAASIVGELVEIGDDHEGQPRLLIHTTREAIAACRASLLFKPVVVQAAKDGA